MENVRPHYKNILISISSKENFLKKELITRQSNTGEFIVEELERSNRNKREFLLRKR